MKCGRKSHESADECNKQYKPRKAPELNISKIVTDINKIGSHIINGIIEQYSR